MESTTSIGKTPFLAWVGETFGPWGWLVMFLIMVIGPLPAYIRRYKREREDR